MKELKLAYGTHVEENQSIPLTANQLPDTPVRPSPVWNQLVSQLTTNAWENPAEIRPEETSSPQYYKMDKMTIVSHF